MMSKVSAYIIAIATCLNSLLFSATYCAKPVCNMHIEPKTLSEVVSQVCWAQPVTVVEKRRDGWAKIQTRDGYQGFIQEGALASGDSDRMYPLPGRAAEVKSLFCHVYMTNDITPYPPLMTLPHGSLLEYVETDTPVSERWLQVKLFDGSIAWVQKGDLRFNPHPLSLEDALEECHKFMGLPYTWGGVSTFGFDCSGLSQKIYHMMGIDLARDAKQQFAMEGMQEIQFEDLEPGDFLFFARDPQAAISHVGIVLGDGEFIHCTVRSETPTVQISQITDPHWKRVFPLQKAYRYKFGHRSSKSSSSSSSE